MKYSLRNLVISFAIVIIVVLLIVLRTFSTLRSQEKELVKIRQSREALQKTGPAIINMQEFESIGTNYFNTGDHKLLDYYHAALKKLENDSINMAGLAVTNTRDSNSYRQLSQLIHEMIGYSAANIQLRSREYSTRTNTEAGIVIMEKFKNIAAGLEAENREVLNASYNKSISLARETFVFVRIIAGVLALILIVSFFFIYHDIKTRKKAEEQLKKFNEELEKQVNKKTSEIRESEKKYRSVIEQASDAIMITDQKGNFSEVNTALCNQFGYTKEELIVSDISKLIDPEQLKNDPIRFDLLAAGQAIFRERRMMHRDGTIIEVEANVKMLPDGRILAIARDITERKKAAEQILKEKNLSDSVINSLPGVFFLQNADGKYLRWNKEFENISGYNIDEIRKLNSLDFFEGKEKEIVRKAIEKVFAEGSVQVEAIAVTKTRKKIPFFFTGQRVLYEGQPCLIGTGIDITERKEAEEEKERARYLLNERVKELTTLYRSGQVFQTEKKSVYEVLQEIVTILPEGWQYPEITAARIALEEMEFVTPNYASGPHKQTAAFTTPAGKTGLVEIIYLEKKPPETEDAFLTEERDLINMLAEMVRIYLVRKHEAEALKKSEANLHTIFNTAETIYVLLDKNFQIISYNQRAVEFAAKELQHAFRMSDNFLDYFPEVRRPVLLDSMKEVLKDKLVAYEAAYPQAGGSVNWYYIRIFPITNPEKKVFGLLWEVSDITEKKFLEQEILDQKVQEQKKIIRAILNAEESERNKIGRELHDNVNQILASIKLYLSMIIERDGEERNELINNSTKLVDNAIEEIRSLSKTQVTPLKKINLEELIQLLVDRLDDSTSKKTTFVYNVKEKIIDDDLKLNIYRIVQEQINNILKHAEADHINIGIITEDSFLRVFITDDGKGFNPEKKRKGVGISNMINRVESFNGELKIESSPGNGCKVMIKIPC